MTKEYSGMRFEKGVKELFDQIKKPGETYSHLGYRLASKKSSFLPAGNDFVYLGFFAAILGVLFLSSILQSFYSRST